MFDIDHMRFSLVRLGILSLVRLGFFLRRLLRMEPPILPEVSEWEKRTSLAVMHRFLVAQILAGMTADICYVEEVWGLKFHDISGHEGIFAKLKKENTRFYIIVDRIPTKATPVDASTSSAASVAPATPATIPDTCFMTPGTIPTTSTIPPSGTIVAYPPLPGANEGTANVAGLGSVSSTGNPWTSSKSSSSSSKNMKRVLSNKGVPAGDEITFYYAYPHGRLGDCTQDLRFRSEGRIPEQGVIKGGVTLLTLIFIAHSVSLELQDYRVLDANCYMFRGLFEKILEQYLNDGPFEKSRVAGTWRGFPVIKEEHIEPYLNPAYERFKGFISDYTDKWRSKKEADDQVKRQADRHKVEMGLKEAEIERQADCHKAEMGLKEAEIERHKVEMERQAERLAESERREAESDRRVQELEALLAQVRAAGGSQAENQL
ncbi:hypothetical protein H2248_003269 [Termitomyces sp. 'cryptogamus']|nr:hypothetical protein H2248_003269 [Termitomyces sp. 'cryptogamus']